MTKLAIVGFAIWLVASVALRLGGQFVLRGPDAGAATLALLLVSLPVMIFVARAVLSVVVLLTAALWQQREASVGR